MEMTPELLNEVAKFNSTIFDNLFNADHRNEMLRKYGYTGAINLTVGQLIEQDDYNYEEFFDNDEGGELE